MEVLQAQRCRLDYVMTFDVDPHCHEFAASHPGDLAAPVLKAFQVDHPTLGPLPGWIAHVEVALLSVML